MIKPTPLRMYKIRRNLNKTHISLFRSLKQERYMHATCKKVAVGLRKFK